MSVAATRMAIRQDDRVAGLIPVPVCCALFVLSGAAGLIYEATWVRYLKTILGHEAYAQALVLSLFLGGLAVGAAIAGRMVSHVRSPLVLYAVIEAVLALAAIYFHDLFVFLRPLLAGSAERWAVATTLILPQSILLGMTFPFLAAALVRGRKQSAGKIIALLYFSNSIGGTIGVLSVGLVLVDTLGLPGSMLVGGVASAVAGLVAWVLHHRCAIPDALTVSKRASKENAWRKIHMFLLVAFGTGMASLIYEVIWVRMLALVVGSSTRAFELMLAVFILGLALGGLLAHGLADRRDRTVLLAKVQLVMGVAVIAGLLVYPHLFELLSQARSSLPKNDNGYTLYGITTIGISLILMFAPTLCAGMTLPLLTRAVLPTAGERALGSVYAWNTAGSIAGILFAIHVLLPTLGLRLGLAAGAAIDIFLALLLFSQTLRQRLTYASAVAAGCIAIVALQAPYDQNLLASGVYREAETNKDRDILFSKHGKTSSIVVTKSVHLGREARSIQNNGRSESSIFIDSDPIQSDNVNDNFTVTMIGALPLLYRPEAQRAAVIGFGTGLSTAILLKSHNLQEVVTAEIEAAVLEAGRYFPPSIAAFEDPRSVLVNIDAKSYFASQPPRTFDIIVSEPPNPWVSGVASLFTLEHFQEMRKSLTDDGVLVQWLHLYENDPRAFATVLAAINQVFDDYVVINIQNADIAILTSPDPRIIAAIRDDAWEQLPELGAELDKFYVRSPNDVGALIIGDRQLLQPYWDTYKMSPNSDYFPILEAVAARSFYMQTYYSIISTFNSYNDMQTGQALPVKRYREEFEPITNNPLQRRQKLIANAVAALDGRVALQDSLSAAVQVASQKRLGPIFANSCELQDRDQVLAIVADMALIMQDVFQHLYPVERKYLWERMVAQLPCIDAVREYEDIAGLIDFYEATVDGDSERIIATGDNVIPQDASLFTQGHARALVQLMLAHYEVGNYDEVLTASFRAGPLGPVFEHAMRLIGAHATNENLAI